jgi:hypothetical protein
MKTELIKFYITWVNDYLTISKMAEDYNLFEYQVTELINIGRMLHEQEVEQYQATNN